MLSSHLLAADPARLGGLGLVRTHEKAEVEENVLAVHLILGCQQQRLCPKPKKDGKSSTHTPSTRRGGGVQQGRIAVRAGRVNVRCKPVGANERRSFVCLHKASWMTWGVDGNSNALQSLAGERVLPRPPRPPRTSRKSGAPYASKAAVRRFQLWSRTCGLSRGMVASWHAFIAVASSGT